jgi:hypothetical protein
MLWTKSAIIANINNKYQTKSIISTKDNVTRAQEAARKG